MIDVAQMPGWARYIFGGAVGVGVVVGVVPVEVEVDVMEALGLIGSLSSEVRNWLTQGDVEGRDDVKINISRRYLHDS